MSLSFGTSSTGLITASISGRALHSSYDPLKEARRFLDERLKPSPSAFIVLGSCVGHLESALAERYPGLRRLSIQYDPGFRGHEAAAVEEAWYPDSNQGLDSFLLGRLEAEDLDGLAILEWGPAAQAYPETAKACMAEVRKAVLTMNGSANALQAFGPVCLLNAVRSAAFGRGFLALPDSPGAGPVVIAASGPSLEEALPGLLKERGRFRLIALSSAALALSRAGLKPDLIVSSDPGYWATLHLRGLPWNDVPLAFPLSARVPRAILEDWPLLAIRDESGFEAALASAFGLPAIVLPQSGTVAALALDLALRLFSGPVSFAGLDLASFDILSHARPNAFDHYVYGTSCRLSPAYSRAFEREAAHERQGRLRVSPQLRTYAAYFARAAKMRPGISALPSRPPGMNPLPALPLGDFLSRALTLTGSDARAANGPRKAHQACRDRPFAVGALAVGEFAEKLIEDAVRGLQSGAPIDGIARTILEQASFSSFIKLRKSERSGDPELRRRAVAEASERCARLCSRIGRICHGARGGTEEPGP